MPTQYRESKAPEKRSYKKLARMTHEPVKGEHGGMNVTHEYHADGMKMHAAEHHIFAKEDGDGYLEHVKKHAAHMKYSAEAKKDEGEELKEGPSSKVESASEPIESEVEA